MRGKKYNKAIEGLNIGKKYSIKDALELVLKTKFAKFNESIDMAIKLGIDLKRSDQNVRGTVVLPKGTGKSCKVVVFAKGEKEKEAVDAGADYVGFDELVQKIEKGWLDFDRIVATPDTMGVVGKLGKILGPRGLMPNPKTGTVTFDLAKAIKELKSGKVEFKPDKGGVVHMSIGKADFKAVDLLENANAALSALKKAKPDSSKGQYFKSISVSSTMGPGVKIDENDALREAV